MQQKTKKIQTLHERELKLLEFIRRLGYGEITIRVQDGLPDRGCECGNPRKTHIQKD